MTIEDQLRDTIKEKYGSITNFSKSIGVPATSIYSILQRGIANAGIAMVIKIFDAVGLDASSIDTGCLEEKKAVREYVIGKELEIVKKYRTLDAHGKRMVDLVLDEEAARVEADTAPPKMYHIKIAGFDGSFEEKDITEEEADAIRNLPEFTEKI